jgi:hypothetical protein
MTKKTKKKYPIKGCHFYKRIDTFFFLKKKKKKKENNENIFLYI